MAIVERERPLEGGFQTLLMKPEEIHTTVSFDEFLSGLILNSLIFDILLEIIVEYQIYARFFIILSFKTRI